jgi:hypothetical protein
MDKKDVAIREIYIALEILQRRCEEFEELKEFPGQEIEKLMQAFTQKYMD